MKKKSNLFKELSLDGRPCLKEFSQLSNWAQAWLESWQSRLLSKACKATLICSMVQAILVYSMSTFLLPLSVCRELDKITRRFLLIVNSDKKYFLAFKAWDELCTPRESRGLGFRLNHEFNQAILSKLAWKIAYDDKSFWCPVLRAKYLKSGSCFSCMEKPSDS